MERYAGEVSNSTDWSVQRFCRQFLQADASPNYPDASLLRLAATQEYLYSELFAAGSCGADLLLPPGYVLKILKLLVAKIEESIDDWNQYGISDNLMLCLANLAANTPASAALIDPMRKHRVQYYISSLDTLKCTRYTLDNTASAPTITLLENRATIAASGTTGIRTWEAAFHLGEYLCRHRHVVKNKRVLELGAGTGYISILCAKFLEASSCVITDGSPEVVQFLPANLALNGVGKHGCASARLLEWGPQRNEWSQPKDQSFDSVLGADITFDERDMPSLLTTISWCVRSSKAPVILIAATERNRKTFDVFVRLAAEMFDVQVVVFPVPLRDNQRGPFYSDAVPIHICKLQPSSGAGMQLGRGDARDHSL